MGPPAQSHLWTSWICRNLLVLLYLAVVVAALVVVALVVVVGVDLVVVENRGRKTSRFEARSFLTGLDRKRIGCPQERWSAERPTSAWKKT